MKKYDAVVLGVILVYILAAALAVSVVAGQKKDGSRAYLVEVNRILRGLEERGSFSRPDLREYESVREVSWLPIEQAGDLETSAVFYRDKNGLDAHVEPLWSGNDIRGWVRFDYAKKEPPVWIVPAFALFSAGYLSCCFWIVRRAVIKPFHVMASMPYELARGRLNGELYENSGRFFGRFIWGIGMLRDNLKSARIRELRLEKEKKTLLLSISHDIKTPLNTIQLYAKALEEGLFAEEAQQKQAAGQIAARTREIESFIKEIVSASSQDILQIEVKHSEFYLKELAELISEYFMPKCRLKLVELEIGTYQNKLLKGDLDRVFEVVENIMENAFKYGDGGGIHIQFYEEEYCQLLRISSSGNPVPIHEMPHLFDSFYRGSNAGHKDGNGLGLYICRRIMQKMDGEIFAERGEEGMHFILVFR